MKLSDLVAQLLEIYEAYGDMDIAVIRNGNIYEEIELFLDFNSVEAIDNNGAFLWLEAYKHGE